MILTESTMKYILTFILSFLSFLVCSQNITITDIPTIDQLPVNAIHRVFRDSEGYMGSPDKPGGLSIQLCKSEKKEFYIRYSS